MTLVPQITAAIVAMIFLIRAVNLVLVMRWHHKPKSPGSTLDVDTRRVYCTLKEDGTPTIVIEPAVGAASAEWWGDLG
jgi:hypothetical protein